jgi:rhamnose utilization protein RhaD (predicted bifunctional aldolase and dehydrogenase)/NAD(P)-dependent dehydrogenase (short-subunit alcohol dehydrogenase family)
VKGLWDEREAAACRDDLALRVYSSRLLGRDPSLVLHGGGNTSVKITEPDVHGEPRELLYVKGSGADLAHIDERGFTPLRLGPLCRLASLPALSDEQMVNELATLVTRAGAPAPSVEAILHGILPHRFVDHTHADALLAVSNSEGGAERVAGIYGRDVVIVPYVMPGFDLARACVRELAAQAHPGTLGMVLLNHGVFSFGATARESYERMLALVARARAYLDEFPAPPREPPSPAPHPERVGLARLRRDIADAAGRPMLMAVRRDARTLGFARRADVGVVSQQGTATPDHVIRTKRLPLLGRDVASYVTEYRAYFERQSRASGRSLKMLDPAPRVVLDPEFGLATLGTSARDTGVAAEIYEHTIDVIEAATRLGGYRALGERDLFDVEYWSLEQAKLARGGAPKALAGEVALVTGAASGIGRACVESLLARGAAVVALDRDPAVEALGTRADLLALTVDVTDTAALATALDRATLAFGGLDCLVLNAGVFPGGTAISALADDTWRQVMQVNLDANLALLRLAHPLLTLSPRGGRVVVVGSKNVPAPGPGAAAYSASKAALTQLARVAALEWGRDRIRVNVLHPNAVFDTGLWSPEVLESRARHYGLSVEEYKTQNVLKVEVRSRDVAELAAEMCGTLFDKVTGAQLPVDGGNERVI